MAQGTHALGPGRRIGLARIPRRALALLVVLVAIAVVGLYYVTAGRAPASVPSSVATLHRPAAATSVLRGSQATLAADVAAQLFAAAPVVVIASPSRPALLTTAARDAAGRSAPLLLASASTTAGAAAAPLSQAVRAEVIRLHPSSVLAVGVSAAALVAQLPGVSVVTRLAALPAAGSPARLHQVALLVRQGRSAAEVAAAATARSAGVQVIALNQDDPRADPAAIRTLAATRPQRVLALGAGFGTARGLAAKVAVAETGVQLPGGGQILFPGHRLVAIYGSPGTPALGALGQQGLQASIARVRSLAAPYRAMSRVPVVPAFEILATVAQGSPGRNGLYSYESSVASLRPWVRQANKDGLYVILDLQPGRANLLAQAKLYRSLLKLPDVGLALDPEWKLQPGQRPLQQIGSVHIAEVNSVVRWLAALTARDHLPQKLLVLHQFRLSMIIGESRLDTRHSDLAIVIHMDGQGAPSSKQQTWNAIVRAAPRGVFFGWKNFFVKDHPMETPQETMRHRPRPVMISYQ